MTKNNLVSLLAACLLAAGCDGSDAPRTPKAIFIIVDGIPADVIENADTPNLDAIAAIGGYARAYVGGEAGGESEGPTVSAVGYNSLLTGTWADKHNVYDNDVAAPNYAYWDIFRIAKTHDPGLKTAVYSTWTDNRTKLIGDGLPEAGGSKLDFYADGYELDEERFPHDPADAYIALIDEVVVDEAARHVAAEGPDLSWVYLEHTDGVSHEYGDGPEFDEAVRHMDQQIGRIWGAVEERQSAFAEDWLIVVTTDHGRDAATGREHGEQTERERTIWIVTNSTRLNQRFGQMPGIVDILPSICTHMGIGIPAEVAEKLDGRSFID